MTAEVLDLGSGFCPTTGVKVEEKSDSNIYDLWLGSAVADDESNCTMAPQPLVAATITIEAIQNILWANGFPIDPPSSSDVGPGPFEDTQFDVVVNVETTDDVEDGKECNGNNSSPVYESDISEEDLSVFPDIPLSPVLSVMSDSDFDLSGCDSGIEAEFDESHEMDGGRGLMNSAGCSHNDNSFLIGETEIKETSDATSVEGCQSCKQNQASSLPLNIAKAEVKANDMTKSSSDRKGCEETLDFKCQYLWEFLQHLLADAKYNNCIVWKNERRGIFRLTDHQRVANLWGRVKKRKNMTYDKLSRALRYYYSKNILKKVDGQRLTYKFCKNLDGKKFAS